jgi:hypothetical protein
MLCSPAFREPRVFCLRRHILWSKASVSPKPHAAPHSVLRASRFIIGNTRFSAEAQGSGSPPSRHRPLCQSGDGSARTVRHSRVNQRSINIKNNSFDHGRSSRRLKAFPGEVSAKPVPSTALFVQSLAMARTCWSFTFFRLWFVNPKLLGPILPTSCCLRTPMITATRILHWRFYLYCPCFPFWHGDCQECENAGPRPVNILSRPEITGV